MLISQGVTPLGGIKQGRGGENEIYLSLISHGNVVTHLICGGIFSNHFITNFPHNVSVKNIDKSVRLTFLYHPVGQY